MGFAEAQNTAQERIKVKNLLILMLRVVKVDAKQGKLENATFLVKIMFATVFAQERDIVYNNRQWLNLLNFYPYFV